MRIGIIGAGIAGLGAGRILARAGHEVVVIEKSRGLGGRFATRRAGENQNTHVDHGISYFTAKTPEFRGLLSELLEKKVAKIWDKELVYYDGNQILSSNPNKHDETRYVAVNGMNSIGKYLGRWVDLKFSEKAGGLTYIGSDRSKKSAWMINLTTFNTLGVDAVIVATPAPQAYGFILTSQDEVNTLKIIREIDEINYNSAYSLMAGYGNLDAPEWGGVECRDDVIQFICNESSKTDHPSETAFVIKSTPEFARRHRETDEEFIRKEILEKFASIAGSWAAAPDWVQLHHWRYSLPINLLRKPYMEIETDGAPLAVIGDYFEGGSAEYAYSSGVKLAKHWVDKFKS